MSRAINAGIDLGDKQRRILWCRSAQPGLRVEDVVSRTGDCGALLAASYAEVKRLTLRRRYSRIHLKGENDDL
jgi:hypothetical protein